eukprot:2500741-Ditylum_brightwellii.AAC.1
MGMMAILVASNLTTALDKLIVVSNIATMIVVIQSVIKNKSKNNGGDDKVIQDQYGDKIDDQVSELDREQVRNQVIDDGKQIGTQFTLVAISTTKFHMNNHN